MCVHICKKHSHKDVVSAYGLLHLTLSGLLTHDTSPALLTAIQPYTICTIDRALIYRTTKCPVIVYIETCIIKHIWLF